MWVSKNAEFHNDFESVEKVLKKCTIKKLLAKMWRKKALFSLFTHVYQTFFAYNFFWCIFYIFFNGFEISEKFCVFDIFFDLKKKKNLGHISTFCNLWSRMRKKRLKKSKNLFSKCVSDFNFAPIKGSVFFNF